MSIRAIALELYRAQQKVDRLEAALKTAPQEEKDALEADLRLARSELRQHRNILNGEKSPSPYKSRPSTFKPRW